MYTRRGRGKRSGDTNKRKKKSDKISLYIQNVMQKCNFQLDMQKHNFQLEFIKTDVHRSGGYKQLVRFTTDKTPGFVVQQVVKDLEVTPGPHRPGVTVVTDWNYWEIFYVNKDGKSIEADGFVQKTCGATSSGRGRQTGTAYFYPYREPVAYNGSSLPWAKSLQDVFGEHVHFSFANLNAALKVKEQAFDDATEPDDRNVIDAQIRILRGKIKAGGSIPEAGGLPSSTVRPTMTGLECIPCAIRHTTAYHWPKSPTSTSTCVSSTLCYVCSQCGDKIRCITPLPQAVRSR